jgi:hypothetical protein
MFTNQIEWLKICDTAMEEAGHKISPIYKHSFIAITTGKHNHQKYKRT